MRDVDADDDAASTASSLDDLPGPDEFLATAIQKLAPKVTPERASPGGGARGPSRSPAGASREKSGELQRGDDDAAGSRASSADYDDEEREAVVHFLAAAGSSLRRAAPRDDRPANSPERAMEEMTASLKIEHEVTEAVVEDILDEAEMRAAYPAASEGVYHVDPFEVRTFFSRADAEVPETTMETVQTSPSPSVRANPHLLQDVEDTRSLQRASLGKTLGAENGENGAGARSSLGGYSVERKDVPPSAEEATRRVRARLSDALRAVASSLVSSDDDAARDAACPPTGAFLETGLDPYAAEVAEAIASVWRACDAASAALASAMEARDACERAAPVVGGHAVGGNTLGPVPYARGAKAAAKRAMLEEAVFSAWMQSGDSSSNLMFSEGPLPTTKTWPLSPGGSRSRTADAERFAAAAADAALAATPPGGGSAPAEDGAAPATCSPSGRDIARRWRTVIGQLALASLQRVQSELGAEDASDRIGSDLDPADTTSTFVPVPGGCPARWASNPGRGRAWGKTSPPRPPSPPCAVRRSRARSSLEWEDLSLIASYMATTRLLSASLDEWRACAAAAKARRRRTAREHRRAIAMAERERSRVAFARAAFLGWRDASRALTRERRARYGSVSRASIRRLTRSPRDRLSPSTAARGAASTGAGAKTASGFAPSADRKSATGATRGGAFSPRTAPPPLRLFRSGSYALES